MKDGYLLGIDVGTTSLKVTVINEQAEIVGNVSKGYRLITPEQDYVQADAESIWSAFTECLRLLKEDLHINLSRVAGIGIATLCPGLVALDENGGVLVDPIIYTDRRSKKEACLIQKRVGSEKLFELTANGSMAGAFSGSSMLWIRRNEPEAYRKTYRFGHINTFLAQRMTGEFAIDYSNASYTNLFETAGRKVWSEDLCERIGIDMEKLPDLHESFDAVGGLRDQTLIGLGLKKGTPVVIGGADTPCAAFAAGVTGAGDVCESVGTSDVLTICVDKPVFSKSFINRCHVVPGTWIYQGAMSFTGAANQWFLERFCRDFKETAADSKEAYRLMNQEAEEAEPGCGGVVFLPYMQGERSPVWDPYARGVFFGISLQSSRKDLNRAVLEGCGYGLRQLADVAEDITGISIASFTSIGGGAKSGVWAQIKADITERAITVLDMNDMAPVGAALLAGVGAGIFRDVYEAAEKINRKVYRQFTPRKELQSIYNQRYHVYKSLYGESEGKDQKGVMPASVDLTTDLHSMGQYIQDGSRIMFETVLCLDQPRADLVMEAEESDLDGLNYLAGKTVDYVNKCAMQGVALAHIDGGVPNLRVHVPRHDEHSLGALFYFFEFAVGISGYLNGINPFDQPGVEFYKSNMFRLLGKK